MLISVLLYFILNIIPITQILAYDLFSKTINLDEQLVTGNYGVDTSTPIHHYLTQQKSPKAKKRYDDMLYGCYKLYSKLECDSTERARLEMNLRQPTSQHNYTEIGFKKMKVPKEAWEPLISFYEAHMNEGKPEKWPKGNSYVNHWDSPTNMISLENAAFRGGYDVKKMVWDSLKPILEQWTGHQLEPTSMYGIRVYGNGSVLATHVDRLPLVSSAIIQVAQDVDEPWPIEVYDHSGKAWNVTMQPGDITLYESHTVLHGRPFPMNGRLYANLFVHFQPVDHNEMNVQDKVKGTAVAAVPSAAVHKANEVTRAAIKSNIGGHEQSNHDDHEVRKHYDAIVKEEAESSKGTIVVNDAASETTDTIANQQQQQHSSSEDEEEESVTTTIWKEKTSDGELIDLTVENIAKMESLKEAASSGDSEMLAKLLDNENIQLIHAKDQNGWELLHEAIRSGDLDTVKLLVELGADISCTVVSGGAALYIAKLFLEPSDHPIIQYLIDIGAPDIEPEEEL